MGSERLERFAKSLGCGLAFVVSPYAVESTATRHESWLLNLPAFGGT
jgi:hypothetical protein